MAAKRKKKEWKDLNKREKITGIVKLAVLVFLVIVIIGALFSGGDDNGNSEQPSQQEQSATEETETEDLNKPTETDITRITNACSASEDKVLNDTILNLPNDSITVVSRSVASQLRNARYAIEEAGCVEYHSSVSIQRKEHVNITVDVTKADLEKAIDSATDNQNWGQRLQSMGNVDGIRTAGIDPLQVLADLEYQLR